HQVKGRGFRIEPGEIEAARVRPDSGSEAAVVAPPDRAGGQQLGACDIVAARAEAERAAVRSRGAWPRPRDRVPRSAAAFAPVPANGKVDRGALPAPEVRAGVARLARSPREELLCGLFAEVLGLERVGIDDNFFALGGDSIVSIQLVSRARKAGLVITPRAVF